MKLFSARSFRWQEKHLVDKKEAADAINLGFKTISHDILISKLGKYAEKILEDRCKTVWNILLRR